MASKKSGGKAGRALETAGKIVLYSFSAIGGIYVGVQGFAMYEARHGVRPALTLPGPEMRAAAASQEAQPALQPALTVKDDGEHAPEETKQDDAKSDGDREAEAPGTTEAAAKPRRPVVTIHTNGVPSSDEDSGPAITPVTPSDEREPISPEPEAMPMPLPSPSGTPVTPTGVRPVAPVAPPPGARIQRQAGSFPAVEISRGGSHSNEVALTFDAGADWRPASKILDTLRSEGITTTFFLTGEFVKKNPKISRRIAAEGHEIGNHSWNHPAFTGLSDDAIRDQLRRTDEIVEQTTGKTSHPYFRPPLGARDARVLRTVASEGFLTIYWTLDSRDSVDRGITAEQIRDRVLGKTRPGSIVLMHCGSEASAEALPEIIRGLRAKGLNPVPISELLEKK